MSDDNARLSAYSQCRLCKSLFRELEYGCDVCKPAKRAIETPPGSTEVNAARQALAMLETQMDYLKRTRKSWDSLSVLDKGVVMKQELDCAKALSILLEHIRKQEKREAAEVEQMSPEEQLEVFMDMMERLPPRLLPVLESGLRARQLLSSAPSEIFGSDN